jgi:hypothetical protein
VHIARGLVSRQASPDQPGTYVKLLEWMSRPMALLAAIGAVLAAPPVRAEDMVWQIRSNFPHQVQVAFYSEWRDWEWPGAGHAFDIADSELRRYNVSCNPGEKICLGAWAKGDLTRFWGVGFNRQQRCPACCYICGDGPVPTQVLPK